MAKPADTPHCNLFVLVAQFRGGSRGWGPGVWPPSPYFRGKNCKRKKSRPSKNSLLSSRSPFSTADLFPRVSHLTTPWSSLTPRGGKIRDHGNEATSTAIVCRAIGMLRIKRNPKTIYRCTYSSVLTSLA